MLKSLVALVAVGGIGITSWGGGGGYLNPIQPAPCRTRGLARLEYRIT